MRGVSTIDDIYKAIISSLRLSGRGGESHLEYRTLSDYIGFRLPREAQLDFFQAQKRKEQLKRLSTSLIKRFAAIASGMGASPIPMSDMAILTPLQLMMITIIGGLSCREFSRETAREFFSAAGLNVAVGYGFRLLAQQLLKMIPFLGLGRLRRHCRRRHLRHRQIGGSLFLLRRNEEAERRKWRAHSKYVIR